MTEIHSYQVKVITYRAHAVYQILVAIHGQAWVSVVSVTQKENTIHTKGNIQYERKHTIITLENFQQMYKGEKILVKERSAPIS